MSASPSRRGQRHDDSSTTTASSRQLRHNHGFDTTTRRWLRHDHSFATTTASPPRRLRHHDGFTTTTARLRYHDRVATTTASPHPRRRHVCMVRIPEPIRRKSIGIATCSSAVDYRYLRAASSQLRASLLSNSLLSSLDVGRVLRSVVTFLTSITSLHLNKHSLSSHPGPCRTAYHRG